MMMRIGGFFSGIGAHHSAADRLGIDYTMIFQCEFDPPTANAYDTIHGPTKNLGDITKVHDIGGENKVDVLFWTPPCIRKGDKVLTKERGYIPIEGVEVGDMVMSHDGQWHPVEWAGKTGHKEIMRIKASGNGEIGATFDHKFYACKIVNGSLTEPEWIEAKDLTMSHYLGRPDAIAGNWSLCPGSTFKNGFAWFPIMNLSFGFEKTDVYDLTVKDSHSFTVNGIIVHNCQDISNAGRLAGNAKNSGTRSSLAFEVPRIIRDTPDEDKPRYLVMEEVPMMVSKKFKANFDELMDELTAIGYQHTWKVLNACDYGVAQNRKRLFVISKLNGKPPEMPKPIPLTKCMRDYLEPEPVDERYYLSQDRLKGLIWSSERERDKGRGFCWNPQHGERKASSILCHEGSRKTSNYVITEGDLEWRAPQQKRAYDGDSEEM